MDYQTALNFIQECTKFGIKLGLERIGEILRRMGHPEERFRAIHIAGTNGKGSTAVMYEALLREAGFRVGRFTSPHLSTYRERFVVDGELIGQSELAQLVTELQPVLAAVTADGFGSPTEFEVGTALAMQFFARHKVDLAVIEVGMGGRFDATNIIKPLFSVITHIALDHQQYLGDTLEKIAFEKAGIIKPGIPVVIGRQEPAIERYLMEIAESRRSPYRTASAVQVRRFTPGEAGTAVEYAHPRLGDLRLQLGLIGRHQVDNSLNVLAGLDFLETAGIATSPELLRSSLAKVRWPSRFERIEAVAPQKFYLDGAHNPDGVAALVETLQALYPGERVTLLIGILNNRPLPELAALFAQVAANVVTTTVPDPKSADPEELAELFRGLGIASVAEPDPRRALEQVRGSGSGIVVASGSLYLTGLLRSILLNMGDAIDETFNSGRRSVRERQN
ncbi:dihydrofolate synthase/folylpolyglutamate synthase [Hydrogenispora ethanolica]|uniref:tetrahydrofolate synthase n=1 Tax=Hydrogenispora ethanolica TaxID=1082276 RepID=A0A4R1R9Y9_HYDET|nr:folylpolyglutamate synthase/dihydrofolate synthase family protein [Hydrogenispora ethanolica]TCL62400.1 dihydrofolate synthase/folylpolyglutamate synthase [Hydrogenispora ethanolica]